MEHAQGELQNHQIWIETFKHWIKRLLEPLRKVLAAIIFVVNLAWHLILEEHKDFFQEVGDFIKQDPLQSMVLFFLSGALFAVIVGLFIAIVVVCCKSCHQHLREKRQIRRGQNSVPHVTQETPSVQSESEPADSVGPVNQVADTNADQ